MILMPIDWVVHSVFVRSESTHIVSIRERIAITSAKLQPA